MWEGNMSEFKPLEHWGNFAISLLKENLALKNKIVKWFLMLHSPNFNDADINLMEKEMIEILKEVKE